MIELSKEQLKIQAEWAEQMKTLHAQWLEHPMTKQFLKNLQAFKEAHVQRLNTMVGDHQFGDNFYRAQGMNVKNCDAVIIMMTHSDTFVSDSLPTQPKQ